MNIYVIQYRATGLYYCRGNADGVGINDATHFDSATHGEMPDMVDMLNAMGCDVVGRVNINRTKGTIS